MIRLMLLLYIPLLFIVGCWSDFRQEQAKVTFVNPKYMTNISVITRRVGRRGPYRTNLTATILKPYGNNVTFALILQMKDGGDFKIQAKVCDTVKTKWMNSYMSQFTNLSLDKCPFQPGTYAYTNMELPPRGMPIPVLDGDYYSIMEFFLTATKEKIMSAKTLLHFDSRAAPSSTKDTKGDNRNKKDKKG